MIILLLDYFLSNSYDNTYFQKYYENIVKFLLHFFTKNYRADSFRSVRCDIAYLIKFVLTGSSFSGRPYFSLPKAIDFIRKDIFLAKVLII